jgi:hypothetical protein
LAARAASSPRHHTAAASATHTTLPLPPSKTNKWW